MPLIECKLGAVETAVGGQPYIFHEMTINGQSRFVAQVEDFQHVMCLLNIEHYALVPDNTAIPDMPHEDDDTLVPHLPDAELVGALIQNQIGAANTNQQGGENEPAQMQPLTSEPAKPKTGKPKTEG